MGADDERRIPVPAVRLTRGRLGFDVDALAAFLVVPDQAAVLRLRVDDIRVFGIDSGLEAIPTPSDIPVIVYDALGARSSRRPSHAVVVLCSSVDIVERLGVVHGDTVELGHRKVGLELPATSFVVRFIDSAITADEKMLGVIGVDPQGMIVDMLTSVTQCAPRFPSVFCDPASNIHRIDLIHVLGIGKNAVVVLWTAADIVAHLLPGYSTISRPEKSAAVAGRFDDGIDDIGIGRGDGQSHPPHVSFRQTRSQFGPRFPCIYGFVNGALGSTVN